ncbi:hypothetical protein AYO44_17595 [Planctomycetaceae bacterium SCGC AG-212-F19]|nr:hypothetical protein AYO44_17595 [Planctomycetaceae bacterium SCGC AG-212-F19]
MLLLIDTADANCPIKSDGAARYLPLYYPLKYGYGGPSVQYAVLSDNEIKILYMSDEQPDAEELQYVQVPELPACSAEILPLSYEEALILAFKSYYFRPNGNDLAILNELNREHPIISIGGLPRLPVNAGDVFCNNCDCEFFKRRVRVEVIAAIPPVPVNGVDDYWHEYQGGDVAFYFVCCCYCRTIIAFNVAS